MVTAVLYKKKKISSSSSHSNLIINFPCPLYINILHLSSHKRNTILFCFSHLHHSADGFLYCSVISVITFSAFVVLHINGYTLSLILLGIQAV